MYLFIEKLPMVNIKSKIIMPKPNIDTVCQALDGLATPGPTRRSLRHRRRRSRWINQLFPKFLASLGFSISVPAGISPCLVLRPRLRSALIYQDWNSDPVRLFVPPPLVIGVLYSTCSPATTMMTIIINYSAFCFSSSRVIFFTYFFSFFSIFYFFIFFYIIHFLSQKHAAVEISLPSSLMTMTTTTTTVLHG